MHYLGIIYAISGAAGEALKKEAEDKLRDKHLSCPIIINEQPKQLYDTAQNDLTAIAALLLRSIEHMLHELKPDDTLLVIIAANSVHRAFSELKRMQEEAPFSSQVQLLSMVDATIATCKKSGFKNILLLASTSTVTSALFHVPLVEAGFNVIDLPKEFQTKMNDYIKKGIVNLTAPELTDLISMVNDFKAHNQVDCLLFGCAELKICLNEKMLEMPIIDTSAALVDLAIEELESDRASTCKF